MFMEPPPWGLERENTMIMLLLDVEFGWAQCREYGRDCVPHGLYRKAVRAYLMRDQSRSWKRLQQVLARNARRAGNREGI